MLDNNLKTQEFDELCFVLSTLNSQEEYEKFLSDLCTLKELKALTERLQVAKRISNNETYRSIVKSVPSSSATITRVAKWMREGSGGYEIALRVLKETKVHSPKAE